MSVNDIKFQITYPISSIMVNGKEEVIDGNHVYYRWRFDPDPFDSKSHIIDVETNIFDYYERWIHTLCEEIGDIVGQMRGKFGSGKIKINIERVYAVCDSDFQNFILDVEMRVNLKSNPKIQRMFAEFVEEELERQLFTKVPTTTIDFFDEDYRQPHHVELSLVTNKLKPVIKLK